LAGDTSGSVWGRRNERTEIPIENVKEKQTYYGALNLFNKGFILKPFDTGDGRNTVLFVQHLQALHPNQKLMIIWDNASYHRGQDVQAYLEKMNQGLEPLDWKVTCLFFAPHAPDQNPVEDIWLRGKNFLRKHFYENKNFQQVKRTFVNFLNNRVFDFSKFNWYLKIPQPE
jgi:putative transposase